MAFMLKKNVGLALKTMRSRRSRSFLTILGVVIAVSSVTIVVSVGHGIQSSVAKQTSQYSKDVITVRPAQIGASGGLSSFAGGTPRAAITPKDVDNINKIAAVKAAVPLTIVASGASADKNFDGAVFAVSSDLSQVINQELAFGGFFTSKEESNNIAVLGANAADKMFDQKVPLGRSFTVRGQQFIVSGVLEKFPATPFAGGINFNDAIFVSDSALTTLAPGGAPVYELLARVNNNIQIHAADAAITSSLAKAHGSKDDFKVLSPDELTSETTAAFELLTDFIVVAAVITLLVSGIGIMNVMLVSVTERIHEIGIRKAVGATNRQILSQFMTEAATLSVVGSFFGVLFAFITVWLLGVFSTLTAVYDWKVAGLASLVACSFGVLFGTLPAVKAARKDPIAALRSE